MKRYTFLLTLALIFPSFFWGRPQFSSQEGEIPDLSWAIYQEIDFINTLNPEGFLPENPLEINPFRELGYPVSGYTNQGFPIYDLQNIAQDRIIDELMPWDSVNMWTPACVTTYVREQFRGGNIHTQLFELVGYDGYETSLTLSAELRVLDTLGNEIYAFRQEDGGIHPADWSADERYLALAWGADRDYGNGVELIDLKSGRIKKSFEVPEGYMPNAPEFAGNRLYVTMESWYDKTVHVYMYNLENGHFHKESFTRGEFSYFTGFTEEGLLFRDCDGEEALFPIGDLGETCSL